MSRSIHSLLAKELSHAEIDEVSGGGTGPTSNPDGTEYSTFRPGDTSPRPDYDVGVDAD
tara:strand:+ start:1177 stop:1353 length:177 start_codon:yes stop_codon:yes gene_type:complete